MTDVAVPGARDVRASLDTEDAESIVVACPPHPRHRGHRGDPRLRAVSEALGEEGIACLRFDYGEWDEGYGEREDARNAIRWAAERYERAGVFGYSFGAAIALLAAAAVEEPLSGVSVLAPAARPNDSDLDAAAAVAELEAPLQVLYGAGTRPSTGSRSSSPRVPRERASRNSPRTTSSSENTTGSAGRWLASSPNGSERCAGREARAALTFRSGRFEAAGASRR